MRRNYTQTAISYEKTLKPFFKNLYEGTGRSHSGTGQYPADNKSAGAGVRNTFTID